jgi:hypothetical protein
MCLLPQTKTGRGISPTRSAAIAPTMAETLPGWTPCGKARNLATWLVPVLLSSHQLCEENRKWKSVQSIIEKEEEKKSSIASE